MTMETGVVALGGYAETTLTTSGDTALVQAQIALLLALIPNPNAAPAQSGGGVLDEMSPIAAAHLRVELAALSATFADA